MIRKEAMLLRKLVGLAKPGSFIYCRKNVEKCEKSFPVDRNGKRDDDWTSRRSSWEALSFSLKDDIFSEEIVSDAAISLCSDGFMEVVSVIGKENDHFRSCSPGDHKNIIEKDRTLAVAITKEGREKADTLFWLGWTKNTWLSFLIVSLTVISIATSIIVPVLLK